MAMSTVTKIAPLLRVACGIFAMYSTAVMAQPTSAPAAGGAKPTAAPTKPASPSSRATAPRQTIELTPAERQAIDQRVLPPAPPLPSAAEELVPTAADLSAPPPVEESPVRIEQIRSANRVTEIKVFPSFGGPSYVITNREGRQPFFQTDMGPGLSVPKFFRWEFGGATSPPIAAPPPPPTR